MTRVDIAYETERWELLSRSAALCATEADKVAQSLTLAQRRDDGRWIVPPGTYRVAERAMSTASVLLQLARELEQ
jgi:hypothetical protein